MISSYEPSSLKAHIYDSSICQTNSWAPLQASKEIVKSIVQHHSVHSGFLELPLSFGYRKTEGEQSFSVPWTLIEDGSKIGPYCRVAWVIQADKVI
jgi:hypothetical protein